MLKHVSLHLLAFTLVVFLAMLGFWQVFRFHEKQKLLDLYETRLKQPLRNPLPLSINQDLRFYHFQLTGHFDNHHHLLLDNKIANGKVGYELYTPFYFSNHLPPILVDRGFIPIKQDRATLPKVIPIDHTITLTGIMDKPPRFISLGKLIDQSAITWPLRIEYINLKQLTTILETSLFPYVFILNNDKPHSFFAMPPERHLAYALQWFALSLTLLIIWATLTVKHIKHRNLL